MHIQLDTLGGIAGDMFVAAVIDAWPEHLDGMLATIRATGLSPDWRISVLEHRDSILRGKRFAVEWDGEPVTASGAAAHLHHGSHETLASITGRLNTAKLDPKIRHRAVAIFTLLGEAEAWVHGVSPADVTFHEIGGWDSIVDIVGAAYLIETLKLSSWSVSPIPLGNGRVLSAHGQLPIPAPATARLLTGFTMIDDGIPGERVTPTGAAILRYMRGTLGEPGQPRAEPMILARCGTGFGTRSLPDISNALRSLFFELQAADRAADRIGVIQFEIDDQTAEDLAVGLDILRSSNGVIDVLQLPAMGKKGRMVSHVQVLCKQELLPETIDTCFAETATIGLRWQLCARAKLDRTSTVVDVDGKSVGVKVSRRPQGSTSAKAELESLRDSAGYVGRQRRRADAEALALDVTDNTES